MSNYLSKLNVSFKDFKKDFFFDLSDHTDEKYLNRETKYKIHYYLNLNGATRQDPRQLDLFDLPEAPENQEFIESLRRQYPDTVFTPEYCDSWELL